MKSAAQGAADAVKSTLGMATCTGEDKNNKDATHADPDY